MSQGTGVVFPREEVVGKVMDLVNCVGRKRNQKVEKITLL